MGLFEKESESKRVTVLTIESGISRRFRSVNINCGKCGTSFQGDLVLIATNTVAERDHRLYRKFTQEFGKTVCLNCGAEELWLTSEDAPWVFSPGCKLIFDSLLLFPKPEGD